LESELNPLQTEDGRKDLPRLAEWFLVGTILFAVVSFLILTGAWVYHYLISSPIFTLTDVKVSGSPRLGLEKALMLSHLRRGENLLAIDLDEVCKRLREHPWVDEVSAEKHLPDTIRITINERVPVAVVEIENAYYLLDKKGALFLRIKDKEARGLPILTDLKKKDVEKNNPFIRQLIWDAVALGPLLKDRGLSDFNRFRIAEASGLTMISQRRGISATIGIKDFTTRLDRLRDILRLSSDPRFARLISIDLSFTDQAIMRLKNAKEPKAKRGKG
jgi:cell division protein FtsQ